jgi:hypothetical protein
LFRQESKIKLIEINKLCFIAAFISLKIILEKYFSGYMYIWCMEQRLACLRSAFDVLRRENLVLRRRMAEAEAENRRLSLRMFKFDF